MFHGFAGIRPFGSLQQTLVALEQELLHGLPRNQLILSCDLRCQFGGCASLEPPPRFLVLLALRKQLLVVRLLRVESAEESDVLLEQAEQPFLLLRFLPVVDEAQILIDSFSLLCVAWEVLRVGMAVLNNLESFYLKSRFRLGLRMLVISFM